MTRDSPGGGPPPGGRLSPRKAPAPPAGSQAQHDEHKRELEALRAELDGERLRSQESRRRFAAEARELRETAERDRQLLADQLRSKWEQQRARELHQLRELSLREREAEIRQLLRWKDAELRQAQELLQRERDAAVRQARDLQRQLAEELVSRGYGSTRGGPAGLSSECRGKLQEVLGKLRWETDGDQAARIRHLRAELELERSLFLKYILERFEGEQQPAGSPHRPRHGPQPRLSRSLLEGPRPRSLESLIAAVSPDGGASRSRSLDSSLAKPESSHAAHQAPLEGSPPQSPCRGQQPAQKALEQAANPQEGAAKELPLKPTSQEQPLECLDSPPEGKMGSWGSAGEGGTLAVGQQQEWLSGNNYSQLVKQNTDLLSALEDLERRCTALKEENGLLRRSSFPEMQEKVKRLKKKNADLAIIAKRLEERARKLQESNLKVVNAPIPLSLKGSSVELCKKAFARQRAKDLSEQASILLAKDKQIEALQRECWELQAKLVTGKEGSCWLNLSDFDRLLRESQKEVLRLQRQITLKNLKESLQSSKMGPDSSSPAVTMCLIQETLAPNIDASLDGSSLPKQTPPGSITLAKDIKPVVLPSGNVSEEYENIPLKTDPDSKNQIQHLEVELSKKSKQCENLEQEMEKKQKKCEELEMQLQEVLTENAKVAEENAQLSGKTKWTEKVESENADLKVKLMGVTEERNSAVQLTKGLQTKVEDLEHVLKDMKEMAERRQQLEVDHEETLLALQKKEEEVKYLQQAQVEAKREHEEVVQLLEDQVRELENQYHSQTEHFNLLSQELEQLQIKNSDLVTSNLPHATCCSSEDCHALQCSKNISDIDFVSTPAASKKQTKKLEFQSNSSKSESTQYSPKSCPTPEGDSASEVDELETDKFSLILESERQGPAKLQVFLARYSYDPFDGPNKNPEAELPLTAGEYIYIYGEMDEDGFFEGELMDGRRGLVPSNLIEEVSDDDLMTFVPPKTSDLSHTSDHEMSFLSRSASSGEKSDCHDEEISVNLLPSRLEGDMEMPDHTAVPYPRNLTLIKQFARSVVIGWESPLMPAGWGDVQSYNIYVDTELCQNVRSGCQTQTAIENLDLKIKAFRISVQSVTEKGNSDKMQCTFLVGQGFHIAPALLKLRSITATSAEVTWLPSSSNYTHAVYLNEKECDVTKAGIYWYTFHNLQPSTQYNAKVETQLQRTVWDLPQEKWEQKSAMIKFITPSAGPPDAPLDVQVQPDPSADILVISWLPVTIDAAGSSNGVRVTGYAVYVNGQRVTEVISPTAGSAIVELSQLDMLQGSQKVSVRTVSPSGESVDSVPALIPSAMLNVPSCSSSSKSMSTSLTSGLPYGEFIDSQHVKIPLTHCISSPSSEMFMASQDNKFTIHFTSNCRDSVASLPASIPPPQLFSSQSSSLIHELAMCNIGDNVARDKDDKCLKSYQQTAVSVQHSGLVFPTRWCEESVNSRMSPLKELAEDSQRKRIKKLFVTKKAVLENQTDTSDMKMSMITHYVHSDDKSVKDSTTGDIEGYDESCLSSVPELCSSQLELEEDSYRDIGIHDICVQEVPDISTEKKQMKGLFKEVPSLAMSRGEIQEDQISRTENWQLNPVGDHSHSSDLSDILEEEEEDLDLDTQEENRIKVVGNDSRLPELPEFPMQWAQNRKMSKALRIGQAGTSSFSKTGPLRSFVSEEIVNDDSVRIFVALFDYDPILMSPNLDAAEEELPFKKGQILKVVGDKDADGFYRGEYAGRVGYIPYNMVSEVQVESNETKQHLLKQGSITDEKSVINLVEVDTQNNNKSRTEHSWQDSKAEQLTSKTMVAVFDYNPRENSLNVDVESELTFSAGDIITVFGSVDDDGLYYGELNGQRGLIPSDFLKTVSWDEE
ncbi:peripheral-type benzodiazepine receptor-associated protein 1-like isoform X1 [Lepidochelys kempii]|uniref:peripheral-type benzodiazepine receptor-associated protein 1-like isoform X1 n=1 Tax=Lepidochelys kempii TaxID=8472 RepID=UPI003C6F2470